MIAAEHPIGAAQEGRRLTRTSRIASVALAVLIAVASFMPARRLWGVNHLAYYPVAVRVILLLVVVLSFVPAAARRAYGLALRLSSVLAARRFAYLAILAAAFGSVGIFWQFHSSTLLLGDGQLVMDTLDHASRDGPLAMRTVAAILRDQPTAKGATMLYYLGAEGLGAGIRALTCLLGGILVLVVMWLALRGSMPDGLRPWLIVLVLTSGAMELFFGYIENYAPLVFFAALYAMSGLAFLRGRHTGWLAAALVCLGASVFMHVAGALLVPSFALLLGWAWTEKRKPRAGRLIFPLVLTVVLAGTIALGALARYKSLFLPLVPDAEGYGILTASHALDVVNELLILLPAFPALAALGLGIALGGGKPGRAGCDGPAGPAGRSHACKWFSGDAAWQFGLLILVPCLLFLIAFRAEISVPRDWDLFALTSVGLVTVALVVADRFLALTREPQVGLATVPIWVISLVLGIGWIGVNANSERSVARYTSILGYERARASYGYEVLAKHYFREAKMPEATAAMEKAVGFRASPRMYVYLADLYKAQGRSEDALRVLRETVAAYPPHQGARTDLVLLLDMMGMFDELLVVAGGGTRYHAELPIFHFYYGKALIKAGQTDAGIEQLLECKRLNPGPDVEAEIDRVLGSR